jgi:hypothetical protein
LDDSFPAEDAIMIDMISELTEDQRCAVATLCQKLTLTEDEVSGVFRQEFDRLAANASIPTYLCVLAMNNTKSLLRRGARHAASRSARG